MRSSFILASRSSKVRRLGFKRADIRSGCIYYHCRIRNTVCRIQISVSASVYDQGRYPHRVKNHSCANWTRASDEVGIIAAGVERILARPKRVRCVNNGLGLAVNLDVNQATDLDRSKCRDQLFLV